MYLADAFIQSDCSGYTFFYQYVWIEPTTLYAANAMLYHWAFIDLYQFV